MPGFIFKPTRRELREQLAESASRSSQPSAKGVLRRTEEAFEVQERIERESGKTVILSVAGDAPESKQARIEIAERVGSKDPERDEKYMV